ncbi:MAG: TlpA family protein disulfide reductase [Croceivirga sp.]
METEKKGFTDIPEKEVFKTPVFKLLKNVDHLKLSDSISASSRFYKLMDTITKGLYLFDKTTYLMHSEQEVSNYGKQKTTFEAYKTIGNYVVPTKITTSIPTSGYTQEEILSEVKINPSLGENVFTIDESEREVVVGRTIPNFSFQDMDNPQNQFTNSHLMGKVVLLDFWATWCKPCIKEIPNIQNLYEKYKDKDFEVLSISLDTSAELVKSFRTNRYPLNWKNTILTEAFKDIQAQNMEVSALPKVILIDKEGTIIAVDQEAKGKALEIILEKTLK